MTVYGIDLGTTYSCIAYVDPMTGRPVVIPNFEGDHTTPSVVYFEKVDEANSSAKPHNVKVGKYAKAASKTDPGRVVLCIKRDMGLENAQRNCDGITYRPETISSFILGKLVEDAEHQIGNGEKITDVVITCPAYFGINERTATRMAGEIAGLTVREIINEPTAAAIFYAFGQADRVNNVLVYDLGGGTFDVTMIEIGPKKIRVVCTDGKRRLGGMDWDRKLMEYLAAKFEEEKEVNGILKDPETAYDILAAAEQAKEALSQLGHYTVSVTHGGQKMNIRITREEFEELTADLVEQTIDLTKKVLATAREKGVDQFDRIVLVGGMSKMPIISRRLTEEFGKEPQVFEPDEAVAKGAAICGAKAEIVELVKKAIAEETGQKPEEIKLDQVDSEVKRRAEEEVLGERLPLLGGIYGRETVNVTSKSFGVVALDDTPEEREYVENLILRNTPVECTMTKPFGTRKANQHAVEIITMENGSDDEQVPLESADELGKAILELPPGLPKGHRINVTFTLNREGRLDILAIESSPEKRKLTCTFRTAAVMTDEEIEEAKRIVKLAKSG